jgi:hypothetical protein
MADLLERQIPGAGGGSGAGALVSGSLHCGRFVGGIPSGAKARIHSAGFAYGLKPVPFRLKPVPFRLKPVPFRLKPVPFNRASSTVAHASGRCA